MRYYYAVLIIIILFIVDNPCYSQTSIQKEQQMGENYIQQKTGPNDISQENNVDNSMPTINSTETKSNKNTNIETGSKQLLEIEKHEQVKEKDANYETFSNIQILKKAATEGNVNAEVELGKKFIEGKHIEQNNTEAMKLFERAASKGNSEAKFELSQMYMIGTTGIVDYDKAASYIQQAANEGYFKAQFQIGKMYITGKGVDKNHKKAAYWIEKAAIQGDAFAQYNLALMYENGIGVERDDSKALKWYIVANSLMKEDYAKNIEALTKKVKKTEVDKIVSIAKEIASRTQNIRKVHSSNETVPVSTAFIADYYDNLETGYLECRYPIRIKKADYGKVGLRMSFKKMIEDIRYPLKENEKLLSFETKMYREMGAKLTGTAFNIDEGDFAIQPVTKKRETHWNWPFNPLKDGTHKLYLSISVVFSIFGKVKPYSSDLREIEINVDPPTWYIKVWKYLEPNIWAIITGVIVTIIGAIIVAKLHPGKSKQNK